MLRTLTILCVLFFIAAAKASDRPNVIVILMDDMGFSDLASYGGEANTPNIDRLAKNGLRFRQFYQGARCCPTRAQLMTGVYAHQAGVGRMTGDRSENPAYSGTIPLDVPLVSEVMRDAGYFTAQAGKWHMSVEPQSYPHRRGFERVYGTKVGGLYYDIALNSVWEDGKILYDRGGPLPEGWHGTDQWNDHATKFMNEAVDDGRPFFIYLAHVAPHFPIQAPDDLVEQYRGKFMKGWNALRHDRLQRQKAMGLFDESVELTEWPLNVPLWESLSPQKQAELDYLQAVYMASIEAADQGIGRLLHDLERRGQLENTLIMLLSDNGGNAESGWQGQVRGNGGSDHPRLGMAGGPGIFVGSGWATLQNTPLRDYKHDADEGGIRTPMIVHWPAGIAEERRGGWLDAVGHIIDIAPTCADLAGAETSAEFEGQSLLPILRGEAATRSTPLFWEHEGNAAMRDGKWKLVRAQGSGWRLYDMDADPVENRNLAFDEPDRLDAMAAAWQAWADRVGVIDFQTYNLAKPARSR